MHAGRPLRFPHVDGADAGVMVRAAQAFEMQQALERVVVVIGRAAGDMAHHVLPLRRLADLVEIVVPLVAEQILAELDHAGLRVLGSG